MIRQLQTQLRNEEMSLVLLKKIRQSQVLAEQAKEAKVSIINAPGSATAAPVGSSRQSQHNRGTPPPQKISSSRPNANAAPGSLPASVNNARGNSGTPNMKNVLTPDLSLLKPVSVVRTLRYRITDYVGCIVHYLIAVTTK